MEEEKKMKRSEIKGICRISFLFYFQGPHACLSMKNTILVLKQ